MVFLLAVGYILIITNPPSDLLGRNNENMIVTKQLAWSEISMHMESISIFLALFAILTFFIGISTALICIAEGERMSSILFSLISVILIVILALLLLPYYGVPVNSLAVFLGELTYVIGFFLLSPPTRSLRTATGMMLAALLGFIVISIGFLIYNILPAWIAVILFLLVLILITLALGLALGGLFQEYLEMREHRKRGKKSRSHRGLRRRSNRSR
jgi:O-antigen/teichoic acid export membrane protein